MTHYKFYEANVETNQVLVFLHGFLSDSRTYHNHIEKFTDNYHVITIDLPGHGEDQSSMDETWNFDYITTLLDRILDKYKDKSITLFGYSMGGRVALYYAINGHIPISNLILESTSPGIKEEANQLERRLVDDARAKVLDIAGIELFVNDWEKLPLFQSQLELPVEIQHQIRQQRLSQSPHKMAKALRDYGTGQMPNLWPRLKEIKVPTLILAGEYDEKFVQIAKKMANLIPNSKCKLISATGHTIHVEDSDEFDTMILGFLRRSKMTNRQWETLREYDEIKYEFYEGIAKVTINRPEVRNAFTPKTVAEMIDAFSRARDDQNVSVIVLTGEGDLAFCSGGDQKKRGHGGYVGEDQIPRLNVLDLQRLIRIIPKPVIAMVKGYAVGGGNVLNVVCDLTIAADNAIFGQTGPKVGSFDAGYGSGYLARIVGHKKAREIWYLCRQYNAQEALDMGLVNTVVPLEKVEDETVQWCKEIMKHSPTALRFLKAAMNADTDGLAGLQQMAGDATLLYYTTDEAKEGRDAFKEKRDPDFDQFPKFP